MQVAAPPGDAAAVRGRAGRPHPGARRGRDARRASRSSTSRTETLSGGEQGLLGLAFAPDYASTGEFFVYLTADEPEGQIQVRRYRVSAADPNRADPASGVTILRQAPRRVPQPQRRRPALRARRQAVGLRSGTAAAATTRCASAQNRSQPARQAAAPRARRLARRRQPVHRRDGRLAAGDLALRPAQRLPLLLRPRDGRPAARRRRPEPPARRSTSPRPPTAGCPGANWGWPCFEGTLATSTSPCSAPGALPPVFERDHDDDGAGAIVGGVVVRDPRLPTLDGRYLYARPRLRPRCAPHALAHGARTAPRTACAIAGRRLDRRGRLRPRRDHVDRAAASRASRTAR